MNVFKINDDDDDNDNEISLHLFLSCLFFFAGNGYYVKNCWVTSKMKILFLETNPIITRSTTGLQKKTRRLLLWSWPKNPPVKQNSIKTTCMVTHHHLVKLTRSTGSERQWKTCLTRSRGIVASGTRWTCVLGWRTSITVTTMLGVTGSGCCRISPAVVISLNLGCTLKKYIYFRITYRQ